MKIGLAFTNDWELFGDGSGDYFEIQHNPLKDFLDVADTYGAKLTLMAEVMQQFGMKEHIDRDFSFQEITLYWENIVRETISRGHDVQLHIHPQWIGANYSGGNWKLDMSKSRIADLDEKTIDRLISDGKNYLEEIIKKDNPNYKCIAFRAGGYYIEPAELVIKALEKNDIFYDTSVTKGIVNPGLYDFSNAYSNLIPWKTSKKSVEKSEKPYSRVIEFPIYSKIGLQSKAFERYLPSMYYRLKYGVKIDNSDIEWQKEKAKVKDQRYPRKNRFYKKNQTKGLSFYLSAILSREAVQLDYDFLPPNVFVKMVKSILKNKTAGQFFKKIGVIPVIATGHIKDVHNTYNFEKILWNLKKELNENIEYLTLTEIVKNYKELIEG